MDRDARAAQIAGCVEHTGITGNLRFDDLDPFPANVKFLDPEATAFDPTLGNKNVVRVSFARALLEGKSPKPGESFTDASGNAYRIIKHASPPTAPLAIYHCVTSAPVT